MTILLSFARESYWAAAKYFGLTDFLPDELIAADNVDIDSSLIIIDVVTTDKEILELVQLKDEEMDEDDGIKIFDEPVAMPPSIEVGNTLETLQKLCLFNKKWEWDASSFAATWITAFCNSLNSRIQSSFLTFFERK